MPLPHPSVALLSVILLGGGLAFAQDDSKETVPEDTLEEIVDERAEKEREEREAAPEGADPGESSYNVEDCEAGWKGERSAPGKDPEGDTDQVDDCERIEK